MTMIKLKNVNKAYGNKMVLNDISIEIKEREFVAITGVSGSGKSTLLNIIGLLEKIDKGSVLIEGEDSIMPNTFKATKILREKISYLFQNFALIDEENVENNLKLALRYVKANKKEKIKKISDALIQVGLEGYEKRRIYELSGGEQQRVAIARIILKPGKIILADEPTGSLDEDNSKRVIELLREINNAGKTIVLVTHDKNVSASCDRVISL